MITIGTIVTNHDSSSSSGTLTLPNVTTSSNNGLLLVMIGANRNLSLSPVDSIVLDGIGPLIKLAQSLPGGTTAQIFYLLNPGAGTHDVIIGYTNENNCIEAAAYPLSGVDQVTPFNNHDGGSGTGSGSPYVSKTVTEPLTTTIGGCLILDVFNIGSAPSRTTTTSLGIGQTSLFSLTDNRSSTTPFGESYTEGSSLSASAPGAYAPLYTYLSRFDTFSSYCSCAVAPVSGGGGAFLLNFLNP